MLLEQLLLARCDSLVLTRSSLGGMAAYISEKKQDLFKFDLESKAVVNTTMGQVHLRKAQAND